MKKKLTVNTIAFANLKNRKKQYLVMFISIILAITLSSGIVFFVFSSNETLLAQSRSKYGAQHDIVYTEENSESVYEKAVEDGVLADYGLAHLTGLGYTDKAEEEMGVSIAWLDGKAKALSNQSFIEGAYPENAGEIAIEQTALIKLGLESAGLGDKISLSVKAQNGDGYLEAGEETYTLVGIVSDKRSNIQRFNGGANYCYDIIPAAFVAEDTQVKIGGKEKIVAYVTETDYVYMVNSNLWEYLMENTQGFRLDDTNTQSTYFLSNIFSAISASGAYIVLIVAVLLLTALLAIVNTFNANLKERSAQIGMLRAVGATKRQVVVIFGREALFISLLCTPLGIALSYVMVRLLIGILSDNAVMTKSLWVLAVAGAGGIIVTMAGAMLPLLSAARIAPVQAIRNIARSRKMKVKKIKSLHQFNAVRHLAKRSLTFYTGAKAAVGVILTCVIVFSSLGFSYYFAVKDSLRSYQADYSMDGASGAYHSAYNAALSGISESDMAEIYANPLFSDITSRKFIRAQLHIDSLTDYFISLADALFDIYYYDGDSDTLTYENFMEKMTNRYSEEYLQQIADYGYTDYFFSLSLYSFNNEAVAGLSGKLTDGEIDLSALASGDSVILVAPQTAATAVRISNKGIASYTITDEAPLQKDHRIVCSGSCPYRVGDKINLSIINYDSEYAADENPESFTRTDKEVTIAAIISPDAVSDDETLQVYSDFAVITTHSGMNSFCSAVKYDGVSIDVLDGVEIDDTVEKSISDFLTPIASKYGLQVESNYAYNLEQRESRTRMCAVIAAVAVIGFALSAGIINNSLTAAVRESKREIGTLRAVGAAKKELVQSYIHRLLSMFCAGTAAGFLSFILLYLSFYVGSRLTDTDFDFVFFPWAAIALSAVLFAVCAANVYSKISKEMKNSIVDNIREL